MSSPMETTLPVDGHGGQPVKTDARVTGAHATRRCHNINGGVMALGY